MRVFRQTVVDTWRLLVNNPVLLLPEAVLVFGPVVVVLLVTILASTAGLIGATLLSLMVLLMLAFFPALSSGLMVMCRETVLQGQASWQAFQNGLGNFYWRLVGGFLLLMLASGLLMLPFISGVQPGLEQLSSLPSSGVNPPSIEGLEFPSGFQRQLLFMLLFQLILIFSVSMWQPAVAFADTGILAGIDQSLRFVFAHFLPVLILFFGQWGIEAVLTLFSGSLSGFGGMLLSLAAVPLTVGVGAFFRLAMYYLYHQLSERSQ